MNGGQNGSSGLEISTRAWRALAWTHLTVRGSLDQGTCTQLLDAVAPTLEPGHRTTLDLFEVAAVDAAGAQAIRDCVALAGERDAELTVEDPSLAVRRGLAALS